MQIPSFWRCSSLLSGASPRRSHYRNNGVWTRSASSCVVRTPPSNSPQEFAIPLVFLSAESWDANSAMGMTRFAVHFSQRGYTTLQVDLDKPAGRETGTSEYVLHAFEKELSNHIRAAAIPFAPVIFSRAGGTLISQTYISSNPAAGLVLVAPISPTSKEVAKLLPTPLPEFDYEPRFPLLVLSEPKGANLDLIVETTARTADPENDAVTVEDLQGHDALVAIERWMDRVGI